VRNGIIRRSQNYNRDARRVFSRLAVSLTTADVIPEMRLGSVHPGNVEATAWPARTRKERERVMAVQHRGSRWTPEDDRRLRDLVEAKKSWVFISANLKRPAKTVRDRIVYLQRHDMKPVELGPKAKNEQR
jgi:hypothetical protein